MKISFNTGNINPLFNAQAVNRTAQRENQQAQGTYQERRDIAVISPLGKAGSLMEQLMQQKQILVEQKQSIMDQASEEGNAAGVAEQLKTLQKQIESVDEQIVQTMQKQITEEAEKNTSEKEKPMTKEELQTVRLEQVTAAGNQAAQAEAMHSMGDKMKNDIRTLDSEINGVNGAVPSKSVRMEELKGKLADVSHDIGKKLGEANDESRKYEEITADDAEPGRTDSQKSEQEE